MGFKFNTLLRAILAGSGSANAITISLVSNRASQSNTGVAPYGVQFDATGTVAASLTSYPFSELQYDWDFGDPAGGATWSRGARSGVALKNEDSGPVAAHVFESVGTYTVTLTVTHRSSAGILTSTFATMTVVVTDPDTVFSGANTICVANGTLPVAGVNGVPTGATCYNTSSWATVVGYLATGKRVLLKRGDTWTASATASSSAAGPGIFGAYGSGAVPKISAGANSVYMFQTNSGFSDWRVMDLEFDGTGYLYGRGPSDGGCTYTTWVRIFNHHNGGNGVAPGGNGITYEGECANVTGGNGNNGMYVQSTSNIAVLGHYINDVTLGEHCCRLQGIKKSSIKHSTFSKPKTGGTKVAIAIRGWDSGAGNGYAFMGDYTEQVVVFGNSMDGESAYLNQYASQQASADERLRDILVDGNIYKPTTGSHCITTSVISGMTIRNNLFYAPSNGAGDWSCVQIIANSTFIPLPPSPQQTWIYNNSAYSAGTGRFSFVYAATATSAGVTNPPAATGVVAKNNLAYTPNSTNNILNSAGKPTFFATGASGGATNLCTDYTLVNNSSDAQIKSTSPNFATTPPVALADWRPTSGYAVDGGVYVPVFKDVLNAGRTYPTADIGAVNP